MRKAEHDSAINLAKEQVKFEYDSEQDAAMVGDYEKRVRYSATGVDSSCAHNEQLGHLLHLYFSLPRRIGTQGGKTNSAMKTSLPSSSNGSEKIV